MFGGNKDKQSAPAKASTGSGALSAHNLLVKGTTVIGDIKAETDIRIDGIVEGTLVCEARVVIGPSGYIKGTVTCKDAVIEGKIDGNITVAELLNLRKTAQITGEIQTSKLIVEAGAVFSGQCRMGKQQAVSAGNKKANLQREAS